MILKLKTWIKIWLKLKSILIFGGSARWWMTAKPPTSRLAWRSFSFSARTLCCSALSARRFSCRAAPNTPGHSEQQEKKNKTLLLAEVGGTHDPVLEGDQLLLLLLPALEVSVDQRLQLDQILVLTFLLDVLQETRAQLSATQSQRRRLHSRHLARHCCVRLHQSPLSHPRGSWGRWACGDRRVSPR